MFFYYFFLNPSIRIPPKIHNWKISDMLVDDDDIDISYPFILKKNHCIQKLVLLHNFDKISWLGKTTKMWPDLRGKLDSLKIQIFRTEMNTLIVFIQEWSHVCGITEILVGYKILSPEIFYHSNCTPVYSIR